MNSLANPHQQVFSPSPLSDTTYISSPAPTINSSISGGVSDTNPTENLELYSPPTASPATYHVPSTVVSNSLLFQCDDQQGDVLELAIANSLS